MICLVGLLGIGILFVLGRNEELPEKMDVPKGRFLFYRTAYFLLRRVRKANGRESVDLFEISRTAGVMMILFAGFVITAAGQLVLIGKNRLIDSYTIERPQKGQGSQTRQLQVTMGEELETEPVEIVIKEREYTFQEKQEFLEQALLALPNLILGENSSPDDVREKVELPAEMEEGKVHLQWTMEPADLLDEKGNAVREISEDGELLHLHADLECEGEKAFYEGTLRLMPPRYSPRENLVREVEKSVADAEQQSAQEEVMKLPKEAAGQALIWQQKPQSVIGPGIVLTIAAAFGIWSAMGRERENKRALRSRQMLLDYPAILFQLSMLLNAGMTMQNAFCKMALDYKNRKSQRIRYACEEMLVSYYEMQSGVPEARAYENFGKRCGENVYIRLGTMLSGNLQKGSQGLAKILQEEAAFSMEERRQLAKKLGEEAGTKLLMPMVLMFLIVLVILMAPALLAF